MCSNQPEEEGRQEIYPSSLNERFGFHEVSPSGRAFCKDEGSCSDRLKISCD